MKLLKFREHSNAECLCGCVQLLLFYFKGLEPGGSLRGRRAEERKRKMGTTKRKDDRGMDAQVLLLMDPGAELGWAVLSDTLPSCEAGDVCARA